MFQYRKEVKTGMLDILYEKTITNKKKIQSYFNNIKENLDMEKVNNIFQEYEFTKKEQEKVLAAVDGSYNKKKYMACFVYAICSQTIISKPNEKKIEKESSAGDINTKTPSEIKSMEKILSTYMNILELKSTIDTLQKHDVDYMLMDGSIRGTLSNFPTTEVKEEIQNRLLYVTTSIEEELEKTGFPLEIYTITHKDEILSDLKKSMKEDKLELDNTDDEILRYLESLEQITCIKVLLEKYSEKIICISKTSQSKSLFNENIPDSAVLEYTINKSGYTRLHEPKEAILIRRLGSKKLIFDYPIMDSALKKQKYVIFFTKLSDRGNVLKIELPRDNITEEQIRGILNDLYSASIDGYPYILKKAHEEVVIRNKNMKNMITSLEINEKTGRDML